MKLQRLGLLAMATTGAAACGSDTKGVTSVPGPLAYVRYIEAMPDTGTVDLRVVDKVENLDANGVNYGAITAYHGIAAGARHFKVFVNMGSSDINVVTQVMLDTTLTLTAGTYYTILHTGYARTGSAPKQHFELMTDAAPSPSGSQFALRVVQAAPGGGNYDIFTTGDTVSALPASPTFANLAYGAPSAYSNFATGAMGLRITQAATTTPILSNSIVLAGAGQNGVTSPIPGSTVGGSVLTAFVFAPKVAGSAATSSFTKPIVVYTIDKRL
jgi:hypothetical protein